MYVCVRTCMCVCVYVICIRTNIYIFILLVLVNKILHVSQNYQHLQQSPRALFLMR